MAGIVGAVASGREVGGRGIDGLGIRGWDIDGLDIGGRGIGGWGTDGQGVGGWGIDGQGVSGCDIDGQGVVSPPATGALDALACGAGPVPGPGESDPNSHRAGRRSVGQRLSHGHRTRPAAVPHPPHHPGAR